jgi:heme o synthase
MPDHTARLEPGPEADLPPEAGSGSGPGTEPTAASAQVRAYYELTKPGIALFVMMTAGASFYVAAGGQVGFAPLFHTLLGVLLATAGSLALNQYLERGADAIMHRTRSRPLPSGRLRPRDALAFGLLLVLGGVAHLATTVGWLPALLTLGSALAYDFLYTPLKSRSYAATFVGALPGAMPALIGWSAATGSISVGALTLFGIAFLWQFPHVLALGWLLREDYARAGFFLTPPSDPEGREIGAQMMIYSAALLPISLYPTALGLTGAVYFGGALVLGGTVLWWSFRARQEMTRKRVRRLFFGSLLYQPLLLGLMVVNTLPH